MKTNPKLYEINTAAWLYELSQDCGRQLTLREVPPDHWDRLKHLGFDYVWLMGVWKRSNAGYDIFRIEPDYPPFQAHLDSVLPDGTDEDIIYSPYSIASYEPDPLIGNWSDIDIVRNELHKRDMGLILDFVPNHTSPDHPWVSEHPDYYFTGTKADFNNNPQLYSRINTGEETLYVVRGKDPYFAPWSDTVQLNYFNSNLRSALIGELKKISEHCDGVRCDMAMLVLSDIFMTGWEWALKGNPGEVPNQEFWADVRDELPDMLLMAEAYWDTEWRLQQLGFDYVYDKRLYDRIRNAPPIDINTHLKADLTYQSKLVRFIENHDEPRSTAIFDTNKLYASAVLFSTLPGMKLYHQGQLEGKKIQIPVQLRRASEEAPDNTIKAFYEQLLLITSQQVFSSGAWILKDVPHGNDNSCCNLIAYQWKLNETLKLVVINLGPVPSQGRISLQHETRRGFDYILLDELTGKEYMRSGNELADPGLYISLDGYHVHIFDIKISESLHQ